MREIANDLLFIGLVIFKVLFLVMYNKSIEINKIFMIYDLMFAGFFYGYPLAVLSLLVRTQLSTINCGRDL